MSCLILRKTAEIVHGILGRRSCEARTAKLDYPCRTKAADRPSDPSALCESFNTFSTKKQTTSGVLWVARSALYIYARGPHENMR